MDISFSEAKGMFGTAIELMKKGSQLDAQAQIQKLQEQYLELHAENLELKQRLLEIENFAKEDESMVYEEPFFYLVEGDEKEGPFCPKCWQKDHKKCRIENIPNSHHSASICRVCGQGFGVGKPYKPIPSPGRGW